MVLFLDDAVVRTIRACGVGVDSVDELVLGAASIRGSVGEENRSATHTKATIADELGWIVSHVAALSDNLCGHH